MSGDWTSGPWVAQQMYDTDESDPGEIRDRRLITFGDVYVAEAMGDGNATLIAAAPDLYNALNELLVCCDGGALPHQLVGAKEKAFAALKKARGFK